MSCAQMSICGPNLKLGGAYPYLRQSSCLCISSLCSSATKKFVCEKGSLQLAYSLPRYKRLPPICLSGRKGNSKSENEEISLPFHADSFPHDVACYNLMQPFSWDSLKRALGGLRQERSVQDQLRDRMRELEFDGNGGDENPPGGGSGGDGFDGSEDEGFAGILDEFLQVVLATIGFVFVYIYMIRGPELTRLARDYIKYLIGGNTSMRLRRAMYRWGKFYESIVYKEEPTDWLERAIVTTPTWWHNPRQLARLMRFRSYK